MTEAGIHSAERTYSTTARFFHWLTVLLILTTVPIGFIMTERGEAGIWDATTNFLYSSHKSLGVIILAVVALRLIYRIFNGAPPDEPTLKGLQRVAAHVAHWSLYGLLIAVPIVGWVATSMFPALDVFGVVKLPALAAPNKAMAEQLFDLHDVLGKVLLIIIAIHFVAALFHHFVLRDGVLRRMWPARKA
ncbi:MAG: cytochrome b [Hyphomicrobiaceae bacterium]